jgi:Squalene-hopene cyclase C-terminal domain
MGLSDRGGGPGSWRRFFDVDPVPILASSHNPAISLFARRDLLGAEVGPVSALWDLPVARRILAQQRTDGSWRYPGGKAHVRSRRSYDQLETFRRVGVLVETLGLTREHPAMERAAELLFTSQTEEGDFRGIYGSQYATTYVGAIMELLIKAGYANDPRITKAFRWLVSVRQSDGGWAIPVRTVGMPFSDLMDARRHPKAIGPDATKASSHLVTGMVLRAFAAHPTRRTSAEARRAGELLASRLYRRDPYGDRGDVAYWERVSFPFWFTDIVSALDTLSRLELPADAPSTRAALERVRKAQRADGTFGFRLMKGKDPDLPWWICLAVCRSLARWRGVRR